jgi:hypothetical protein
MIAIEAIRVGRSYRISHAVLQQWINKQRVTSQEGPTI